MPATEVLKMLMVKEIRACLLLHPSSIQFGAGQSRDVCGHNLSDEQKTWGQDEVLSWKI